MPRVDNDVIVLDTILKKNEGQSSTDKRYLCLLTEDNTEYKMNSSLFYTERRRTVDLLKIYLCDTMCVEKTSRRLEYHRKGDRNVPKIN